MSLPTFGAPIHDDDEVPLQDPVQCPHCGIQVIDPHCSSPTCRWLKCDGCRSLVDPIKETHWHPDSKGCRAGISR